MWTSPALRKAHRAEALAADEKPAHAVFHLLTLLLVVSTTANLSAAETVIPLTGRWRFALDPQDIGMQQRWSDSRLSDHIQLPGSLPAQGIGEEVTVDAKWTGGIVDQSFFTSPDYAPFRQPGHVKVPFWLQPERYYVAPAWYQRDIIIPGGWVNRRSVLFLERPHWETRVWVDGQLIGTNLSLSTPHEYDLGTLAPGKHTLSVRVDNRLVIDVGRDSHSVSDHTQGNWNGIVGALELRSTPLTWIDHLDVYSHTSGPSISVRGQLGNATGQTGHGDIQLRVLASVDAQASRAALVVTNVSVSWGEHGGAFECVIPLPHAKLWDEFQPAVYVLEASLGGDQPVTTHFGIREFGVEGTQFTINGRKTFIRGTLECAIFPKTGHPPTEVSEWRRVIRVAKAHGLNNLRFHSWCPPEAAFRAADELGMYLHVECSSWANASTTLGDGKPVDSWIYAEADRILHYYGNHPSFVLMLYGNEPGGEHHKEFLSRWVAHYRSQDARRLYSSAAGWPQLPENQFHVTPDPRIQAWGGGLKSRINALPPETVTDYRDYIARRAVPVISHEIGQWCVYPNFDEMRKYTGYLKPRNFEIFQSNLAAHHMEELARPFLYASGKLQTLCYKEDIESALRTPGMGGFQLLDLHDFPGQGTALVGVVDPFWEDKGYVTAAQFSRFCNATVPLARLSKRVFTQNEELAVPLEVAHFGAHPLPAVWTTRKLVDDHGREFLKARSGPQAIEFGNAQSLTQAKLDLHTVPVPARYKLVVTLTRDRDGHDPVAANDWDLWVYPEQPWLESPPGITLTHELDESAASTLRQGGTVLWLLPPDRVAPDPKLGKVDLGFSSIFWNTAWTRRQAPQTLGIMCDPKHPLFAEFPTDGYSNWQWWYLVTRAGAMILDALPTTVHPDVQVIDDWFTARKLGLVFEARVGTGKLLVCSIDLEKGLTSNPVVCQFRESLLNYVGSDRFRPKTEVSLDQLRSLMRPRDASTRRSLPGPRDIPLAAGH